MGNCAYGGGNNRQVFSDANCGLAAKVAVHGWKEQISRDQLQIDLEEMTRTCPVGQITRMLITQGGWKDKDGEKNKGKHFTLSERYV